MCGSKWYTFIGNKRWQASLELLLIRSHSKQLRYSVSLKATKI
eukprot:SAG11_NODE_2312_length_3537_cov_11.743455_4_plen_43_part_00